MSKPPKTEDEKLMPILSQLSDLIEELVADMRQMQWRVAKLERQYGTLGND